MILLGLLISICFMGKVEDTVLDRVEQQGKAAVSLLRESQNTVGQESGEKNRVVMVPRILLPLLWIGLCLLPKGNWVLYGGGCYLGFSVGIAWWLLLQMGGWRGPFQLWALSFPQSLCYLPALILCYVALCGWKRHLQHRKFLWSNPLDRRQWRWFMLRMMVAGAIYGLGIWLEVGVNPWFLGKIL